MPKDLDLNLLKPLEALLQERSVTRAAERLGVSQPAVSAALAKLRRHFQDELLTRHGNSYQLTPLAAQLVDHTVNAVAMAGRVFSQQPEFEAETSRRRFVIHLSDYALTVLGPHLSQRFAERAPGICLDLRQITTDVVDAAPDSLLHVDAVVLPHGFLSDIPYHDLLEDEWMCLISSGNTVVGAQLRREHLAELSWVSTFHRPTAFTTAVRELRLHGVEPCLRMVSESYGSLPALVAGTDRIALLQRRLTEALRSAAEFRVLSCPVPLAPLKLAIWWHPIHTADTGHQWLRRLFAEAAEAASPAR